MSRRFGFFALLSVVLALPAVASDEEVRQADAFRIEPTRWNLDGPIEVADPNFYDRTGTKPPAGEFLAGFDFAYMDEISPTLKFGWRHKETGVMVVGGLTALRIDAQKGESPFTVGCQGFLVPYSTGSHTRAVYQLGVMFPLRTLARPAK